MKFRIGGLRKQILMIRYRYEVVHTVELTFIYTNETIPRTSRLGKAAAIPDENLYGPLLFDENGQLSRGKHFIVCRSLFPNLCSTYVRLWLLWDIV